MDTSESETTAYTSAENKHQPCGSAGAGCPDASACSNEQGVGLVNNSPPSSHDHMPTSTTHPLYSAHAGSAQMRAVQGRGSQRMPRAAGLAGRQRRGMLPAPDHGRAGAACLGRLGAWRMHGRPPPCKGATCHAAGGRRAESSEVSTCAAGMKPAGPTWKGGAAARAPLSSAPSGTALLPPPPSPPPAPGAPSAPGSPLTRSAPAACDRSHKLSLLRRTVTAATDSAVSPW
jgi:hypothetical protein